MDTNKFMQLFASANEVDSDLSETKEALRKVLEDGRHWYCDISGDGTQYLCTGTRHGVGFSQCWITLQPDGMAVVRAVSTPVPEEHVRSMSKLCRSWNKRFMVEGLSVQDLDDYRAIIQALPYADRSCGFICSRQDLACWNPLEIAHLVHSTRDYVGTLCDLVPKYTREDVRNFVRMSLNNLYHELCHRRVHRGQARSLEALPAVYKGVFFILQDLHYLRTGVFIGTKAALLEQLQGKDRDVLACALALSCGGACDLEASFEQLFAWCQEALKSLAE